MSKFHSYIAVLEKCSLVTCSKDVLPLLERTLENVKPILNLNLSGPELLWQNGIEMNRLRSDKNSDNRLSIEDLRRNASGYYEDYVAIGLPKQKK